MSRIVTPSSLPSRSMNSAPGCPLTSSRRVVMPPRRAQDAQPRDQQARHLGAAVDRTRGGGRLAAAVAAEDDVVGQQLLQPLEIAVLGGREEARRERLALRARDLEPRALLVDVAARPCGELAGVLLARADDLRDPVVGLVEHLAQQERRALLGRQALEQHEEGERQRVRDLGLAGGIVVGARDERLRQPLAHVGLAPDPRRAEVVEREPRDHRRQVGARRLDPLAARARPVEAEESLLHHVLRLAARCRASGRRRRTPTGGARRTRPRSSR